MKAKGAYRAQFNLEGKVALVTGGAGILGRHFCAALADSGADVAVLDLSPTAGQEVAEEISDRFGVRALGVGADVANPSSIRKAVDEIEAGLGPIDILHNNAASKGNDMQRFFAAPEEYSQDMWRNIMSVNLDGMFWVAQAVGARMASRGRGSIIQTASIYGIVSPDQRIYKGSHYMGGAINTPPVYAASKAGVVGLTKYLATYWAPKGVRVNCLTPGGVESGQNETFKNSYAARTPMGRMADAHEMTGALLFLASDAASYVTGHNLVVDGGWSVW
jgi:NAD(P)-dependent dehydrogenase (short-subunit alcohol dehydrogenase family)